MMKRMKVVAAMLLSATMLFGLVACGGNQQAATSESSKTTESIVAEESKVETPVAEKKDPVTLEWYYRGNGVQQDSQLVEDKVNELLKDYPGLEHITVHMNCYTSSEYSQAVTLAESAGEQIDILSTVSLSNWKQNVEDGSFMEIDDLISDDLKATLPDWLWDLGKVEGKQYIIPTYQNAGNNAFLLFPTEYAKYLDVDALKAAVAGGEENIQEIADILAKYVTDLRAGIGSETKWLNPLTGAFLEQTGNNGYYMETPYDVLTGGFIVKHGTGEVTYRPTSDYAKALYQIAADWYADGITHPDVNSISGGDYLQKNMMNPESYVMSYNGAMGNEAETSAQHTTTYGFDVTAVQVQNNFFMGNNWAAGGQGIHSTCENPEDAMLFLEAINTGTEKGKELYNTIVFGIEGKHYTKDASDANRIETIEYTGSQGGADTSYAALKWIIGNTFNAYKNQAVADGYNEAVIAFNENPNNVVTELAGFNVKTSDISTQLEQIAAVTKEYKSALWGGVEGDNWSKVYDEYYTKLENAGLNDVLVELQSQVDAFLGK